MIHSLPLGAFYKLRCPLPSDRAIGGSGVVCVGPAVNAVSYVCLQLRRLGAVHRYTIQCVLPINLFNEKIYLFFWFWTVLVAIVTCISALSWLLNIVLYIKRKQYVRRYVNLAVKLKVSRPASVRW